ncbi:unnamed protein product [Paramecium pentaurelia]|uniref:EF-hand domain-containing protein n=1 Tax=Paramecium pentaurelia TaxID=43138 RepID=A0A8S1TRA5_9CILI|nr:unnamed protein product [Paramecium pentaurelia]
MITKEQKWTPIYSSKIYPGFEGEEQQNLHSQEQSIRREEEMGNEQTIIDSYDNKSDDQKIKEKLQGRKEKINQWMVQFQQQKSSQNTSSEKYKNERRLESLYSGMILLRRLTRIILQFLFIAIVVGLFALGYFVTVKNSSWSADIETPNIDIFVGNCFVNVSQSDDYLQFSFKAKGSLMNQVNKSDEFRIKGEILDTGVANLTFYDPFTDLTTCIIDLKLPKNIENLNILCKFESECVMAFGLEELVVNTQFNATSEPKARMQINIRNIQTNNFIFESESSGNLFLNHFLIPQAHIKLLSGDIIVQSTKSYYLNYSTQSQAVCAAGYTVLNSDEKFCYQGPNEKDSDKYTCEGLIGICEEESCDLEQNISIIGNSSTIYANILQDIGKPLIETINYFEWISFDSVDINFNQESLLKIQKFMNKSGSADIAVRLDVGGHYLLQHTYSTYWTFFSNPSYAAFQPWWLSAFSGTFLNPQFQHLQVSLEIGFCPWNPALNARQTLKIQELIQRTFNTTYGQAIFIEKDNFIKQNETLNENLTYPGFEPLYKKERGKFENWSTLENFANNVVYQPLEYNMFFLAAIGLSLLSSLIFALVCLFILIVSLQGLETYVLETSSQFQNYSTTTNQTKKDQLSEIAKKMIRKLDQLSSKKDPPILLGVLSYIFYVFSQQQFKSAPKMFCKILFKKSNKKQTEQYYQRTLDKSFLRIDEEEIKEQYEQFCYLNKLTIEPLTQQEQLLEQYGFQFAEKDDVLILSKIKLNPNAKSFQELSDEEKTSGNSLELFMATQCLLTGIPADIIPSDKLEKAYIKFCGKTLRVEQFNIKDLSNDYGLLISDIKAFELRKVKTTTQQRQSWYVRALGKCTHYLPFVEDYYLEQPVFLLRRNVEINKFQQNPIQTITSKLQNASSFYYNHFFMFIQSLVFNYKTRLFNREYTYREEYEQNILMDYFDAIYMNGWILSDLSVVLGNFLVTAITIIPLLYFIVIINTSYSPFSIYDPKNLIFINDALIRPWTIADYINILDFWVLVLGALLGYYALSAFMFQTFKYLFSYFPDEVGYMWEFKFYQNKIMKYYNWFQWIQFLILAFSVFFYFGLIIVWLILGSIINPNYYLVYSSSALSLVAFIAAQIQQIKATYEYACNEIKKMIHDIYLRTFSQLAGTIIKEVQKLSDLSTSIINSTNMDQAKIMAENLGFGEELNELCILTQGMLDNAGSIDLNQDQINFKHIKDKFIQKACEKFIKIAKDQFDVSEIIAEQLVKANFVKFDEIIDPLANQIQIQSENKIPAGIVKWIYQTSVKLNRVYSKKTPEEQRKELQIHLPIISVYLLDAIIDGIMIKTQIEDKGASQQALKSVMLSLFNLMMDSSPKNILIQVKKLFENIKDFVAISPIPLQALEMIFDYAQSLNENINIEESKQELIKQLLQLFNIDQDIAAVYQLLYSKQQSLYIEKDIQLTPTEQAGVINRLCDKYFLKDMDQILKTKFEIFTLFAMKFLKNDKPPLSDLVKLFAQINPGQDEENEEYFEKLLEQNYGLLNVGFSTLQLCTKNWKQELPINIQGKSLELVFDVLYVSSRFLWSSSIIDKNNSDNEPIQNQDGTWTDQIFAKPALQILQRKDKLVNRDIIELISLAFQIPDNAVIGLILILRNEIQNTIFHDAIYYELIKITSKQIDSQVSEVKFIFELLSITNFEEILSFLCSNVVVYKQLIEKLLDIIFSSKGMFRVFNGFLVIERILDKSLKLEESKEKIYLAMAKLKLFGTAFYNKMNKEPKFKEQINKIWDNDPKLQLEVNEQSDENEDQLVNYYKNEKITFFTFLKKSQRDEKSNKQSKTNFLAELSNQIHLKLEYLYMILEQQQSILSNNTLNSPLLNGLKVEPFKNLLVLVTFKDAASVSKALKYFINFNPKSYESIDLKKVQIELQKIIDVEQNIGSFQLPNTIPYQFQKLQNLYVNQIFLTKQSINLSLYNDLFNFIKYEIDKIKLDYDRRKQQKILFEPVVKHQQLDQIQISNLQDLIHFSENFVKMMFNRNSTIRDQAIKDVLQLLYPKPEIKQLLKVYPQQISNLQNFISGMMDKNYENVLSYLIQYCDFIQEVQFRKFFKKVLSIVRGFVTLDAIQEDDGQTKKLILATQQLKYFLSSDLDCFMDLLQIYFDSVLKGEKHNQTAIQGFFSLMTTKPDFDILVKLFRFEEEAIKFAQFLVSAIFSEKKSKILQDPKINDLIENKFGIKDVSPLIDLSDILESSTMDSKPLIIKLRIEQNPTASKLFQVLFAFKRQLVKGESWKQLQDNYNTLADQRLEIFKQDKENKKKQGQQTDIGLPDVLEVLHFFSHPRPTNFLYLLNRIQLLDQQEPAAIFTAAIAGIGKYDKFDQYKNKQPEQIRNRSDVLQKLSQKSVDKALLYIVQTSDQDIQEAFSLLQVSTGINPLLVSAIFNENYNSNTCLQQLLQSESTNNQKVIKEFMEKFNAFGYDAITLIKIIEFETLKNSQHEKLTPEIMNRILISINLNLNQFNIIENFLKEQAKGKVQYYFPLSSLVLIYSLKQMRQIKKTKDKSIAQYIKGQYCINMAFTVFERYLYFYDNKNLINLNKPALVKLLSLGIFDTTKLRASDQQIDYVKLEGILYPGISDPLLQIRDKKFNYTTQTSDSLGELSKNFNDQYDEYCKIFYRILPDNNEEVVNRPEFENYNEFWTALFKENSNKNIPAIPMIYINSQSQINNQKDYFEEIGKSLTKEQSKQQQQQKSPEQQKLELQYILISKLIQLNISQYGYIRSKYWDKSIELIKKQIFKQSEIEVLESDQSSEQLQQIMIQLMQYYAGQYTVSQNETINKEKQQQQNQPKETSLQLLQGILGAGQKYRIQPKFRGVKSNLPINLNHLIDILLGLNLNETERKELKPLVDLFYNPKVMDTDFITKTWGNDQQIMDAVMLMLVRVELENSKASGKFSELAKKVPVSYLYYSLGDQYENLNQEILDKYQKNSEKLNLGIDELIQNCNEIQPLIKQPLKLMIRCFLGDVEAWYSLIAFSREQKRVETDLLSESMTRTFIIELLLQFKNFGFRSPQIKKQIIQSQTFQQLLKSQMNINLIKILETAIMNTFLKQNQIIPQLSLQKIIQYLNFVFEGKTEVLTDSENSGFIEILIKVFKIDKQQQSQLVYVIQFIFQLLFKGDKSNANFALFESQIQVLQDDKNQSAWEFTKAIIEVDHSKNINVLISKAYQILQRHNLEGFQKYPNLLVSLSSISYLSYYPTSNIDQIAIMNVLLYPIIWLGSTIQEIKEPITKFTEFSKNYIQQTSSKDFEFLLNNFYEFSNQDNSSQYTITEQSVNFYQKALLAWCQQNQESDLNSFINFIKNEVFDIKGLPAPQQVLVLTLLQLLYNTKIHEDPEQNMLKQFIKEITKVEALEKQKDVIEATIIMFSGLSDPKDIKGDKFFKAISTLLSNYKEIGEIIKMIIQFYQTEDISKLKELPQQIQTGCFNNQELYKNKFDNVPLAQLFLIASNAQKMIKSMEDQKEINEKELLKAIKPVLEPMFEKNQEKDLQTLIKCIEAIIAIKQKKFNEVTSEFFQVMKISQSNSKLLISLMKDFQVGLESPQQLIKEKMASLINPTTVRTMQYMNSVMSKLNDNRELQYEDMFRVLDKNGQRSVKAIDVIEFLRRINIEITEHKFREVLVVIKKDQVNIQTCMIDFYEFKEIMQEISIQTMLLSLEYLGISKPLLIKGLIVLVLYLIIVLAFILIGVQAFAIPGTFAAIVNAILPMIGGLGLNKQAAEDKLKSLNLQVILELVKKAIKVIQSRRI